MNSDWIVVFTKQPLPNQSKTRLASDMGADKAHALAEAFLLDTLEMVNNQKAARVLVSFSPPEARDWFAERIPGAELAAQPDGSFGERLHAATLGAFSRGASRCVLIGSDTPQLQESCLIDAFAALQDSDVCLGPAADGGYYLIGLKQDHSQLFQDMPWSTEYVHSKTVQRALDSRLTVHELHQESDIDEAADLTTLRDILRERRDVGFRTRKVLELLQEDHK